MPDICPMRTNTNGYNLGVLPLCWVGLQKKSILSDEIILNT